MARLTIKGSVITIPDSGSQANWSEGVIDALTALTDAVNSVTGTYDVAPQIQNIDANNSSTNVTITSLIFPPAEVRSTVIYYSVYRLTEDSGANDDQEVAEGGTIVLVYNASNPVSNKWTIAQTRAENASITFSVTDLGQVQFTTTALTGINHVGTLSFRAISILN